jgi:subtilisin family serine protease
VFRSKIAPGHLTRETLMSQVSDLAYVAASPRGQTSPGAPASSTKPTYSTFEQIGGSASAAAASTGVQAQAAQLSATAPTDPLYGDQWHLAKLGDMEAIWKDYTGKGVHVGVVDSGVEYSHPDLNDNYDASLELDIDGKHYDGYIGPRLARTAPRWPG